MTPQYRHHLILTGKLPITWEEFARLMRFAIAAVIQLDPKNAKPDTTTHPKP
jgi:hypothetical protein